MDVEVLRDDQWEKGKPFVPGGRKASTTTVATDVGLFDALL
jgi:hypothetical protein